MKATIDPAVRVPCAAFLAALFILLVGAPALADSPMLSMPNPAAVYCEELGYEYVIVDGDGGQHGVCALPDGRRVDAWDFYRGKVATEYSYCALQGLGIRTKRTDTGTFTSECAVCVSEDGRELGTVGELMGLSFETINGIMPGGDEDGAPAGKDRHSPKSIGSPFGGSPPSGVPPAKFDWRTMDGTTAVKAQGSCGSCWAFSTAGAFECNILIKDGVEVDLAEQWLVSCNQSGWSCSGGGFAHGYHMLKRDHCGGAGAVLEDDFPYTATNAPCDCPYPHGYSLDGWGFLDKSVEIPDTDLIKRAIMRYGPVSVGVMADQAFSAYHGGVFTGGIYHDINHAVVLVGWDDNQGPEGVWFLRNSWGMMWGENGYMKIGYGRNAVGWSANWVEYRDPIQIALPDGTPGVIQPGAPTTISVRIDTHTDSYMRGTGVMHYRLDGGDYNVLPLDPLGGGLFEATLPAVSCGDAPECFFAAAGVRYGTVYNPPDAAGNVHSFLVGTTFPVFTDDFETDTGWTVQNGAELTGGSWERGVPAGAGDRSDPTTDYDGSGSCFLTGNLDGDSDVDKDWTRVTSPMIDLTGGSEAVVEFAYWYRNDHGDNPNDDYFITYLSDDGGASWTAADTIGPRAPLPQGWHRKTILVGDHIALTDLVRVRVEVADLPGGSLVEAAIDDFSVSYLSCGDTVTASDDSHRQSSLALRPNAPNPFGLSTVINYELPGDVPVFLTFHNASGRVVRTLVDHERRGEGPHAVRWDGCDDSGRAVAAGAYFYRIEAGGETLTAKMLLLK
ncbi:MAG: C1 family peptidase [Candidatus Eisenbacteria bacterium]